MNTNSEILKWYEKYKNNFHPEQQPILDELLEILVLPKKSDTRDLSRISGFTENIIADNTSGNGGHISGLESEASKNG